MPRYLDPTEQPNPRSRILVLCLSLIRHSPNKKKKSIFKGKTKSANRNILVVISPRVTHRQIMENCPI